MNLVDLRDRLVAIDSALSEIAKYVDRAGKELIKANMGIGAIMGEGARANGTPARKRQSRKPKVAEQADQQDRGATDGQEQTALTATPQINIPAKRGRGRPKTPGAQEEGNSDLAAEAS